MPDHTKMKENGSEYSHGKVVEKYSNAVSEIGLWKSEEIIFSKYMAPSDKIADIGCGAGRTTFSLYALGYHDIIGIDLSEKMISACNTIKDAKQNDISFLAADATKLPLPDGVFDVCIFSFNGLMTIPKLENRLRALKEICRVLKTGGKFIFTAHDINNPDFSAYWAEEKIKWEKGAQDERLHEYGDLLFSNSEEYGDTLSFVHVPPDGEVESGLDEAGFIPIYSEMRSRICQETDVVLAFAVDCKFWVAEKK